MPTTSTTRTRPPDGFYSAWDIAGGRLTHWRVSDRGRRLDPWPSGAKYGPVRPVYDPAADPESRREAMRRWKDERDAARQLALDAIAADPQTAAQLFVRWTGRCRTCRESLTVDDLQPDGEAPAAPGEGGQAHSAAVALLAAALDGRAVYARHLLNGADPARVIAQLADVIAALAALTAPGAGEG